MKGLRFTFCVAFLITMLLIDRAWSSTDSIGPNGINSAGLGLTGAGISIGQVEVNRPGKRITDGGPDMPANANANIVPAAVFRRDGAANTADVDPHAEQVAGVMISTDMTDGTGMFMNGIAPTGVATSAALYASAYNVPTLPGQSEAALSAQHVALQDGGDVRAINFSFGEQLDGDILDGNSLLTKFVDWSSNIHDTLYVIAGNEGSGGIPIPTDDYNGLTIAYSTKVGGAGKFRQLAAGNFFGEDAIGPRVSTDLLAPGDNIEMASLGGVHVFNSGTSFAAPHVTGTVALLQQFADARITPPTQRWDADARQPEVMKAVLLNSADKIEGILGMDRTVVETDGTSTWLDTDAFNDVGPGDTVGETPLDLRMGAGHLNASRARTQFSSGEYEPDAAAVPAIGWDFDTTTGDDDINKYPISPMLNSGSYVSLTLAWNRTVEFEIDADSDGAYDIGDDFLDDCCFVNLDLYLMPAGATMLSQAITSSQADDGNDTVEHIFFQLPTTGSYEIWIHQFASQIGLPQVYALAWWTAGAATGTSLGDYNGSGIVDATDYNVWKSNFGTTNAAADGNGDGIVNAADYTVWRNHLGQMAGSGSAGASPSHVPEPSVRVLLTFAMLVFALIRADARRMIQI